MKKLLLMSFLSIFSIVPNAYSETEILVAPKVQFSDALGIRSLPITAFCLGREETVLKTLKPIKVCLEASHIGRGHKKCEQYQKLKKTVLNKFLVKRINGPRSHQISYEEFSYGPVIEARVYDFSPRSGKSFKRLETVSLKRCD